MSDVDRTVLFVCQHGGLRSRLAAALYNAVAPRGWRATSAGLEPQAEASESLALLLDGDPAESLLDSSPPRAVDDSEDAGLVVAIDCVLDNAETWTLLDGVSGAGMREELRQRVRELASRQAAFM